MEEALIRVGAAVAHMQFEHATLRAEGLMSRILVNKCSTVEVREEA